MIRYTIKMQHDEKTFEALSRMQYDLFCSSNRITRTILSILLIAAGIVNFTQWWGILLAAYGCYLTTSTYSSRNRSKIAGCRFRHPAMNSLMIILKFMFFLPVKKKFP